MGVCSTWDIVLYYIVKVSTESPLPYTPALALCHVWLRDGTVSLSFESGLEQLTSKCDTEKAWKVLVHGACPLAFWQTWDQHPNKSRYWFKPQSFEVVCFTAHTHWYNFSPTFCSVCKIVVSMVNSRSEWSEFWFSLAQLFFIWKQKSQYWMSWGRHSSFCVPYKFTDRGLAMSPSDIWKFFPSTEK